MPSPDRPASDADSASRWVREHGRSVRGYILSLVRREDEADDLLQEVFRRAWQARNRYEERGYERAWLLRIADHLVCDRARRPGREQTVDAVTWRQIEPGESVRPDDGLTREDVSRELARALGELTVPQQRVLLLRYYGEMDFAQIAQVVGCPLSTALSHARRGLLALRKVMAENAS